jgi:hypothetical protein
VVKLSQSQQQLLSSSLDQLCAIKDAGISMSTSEKKATLSRVKSTLKVTLKSIEAAQEVVAMLSTTQRVTNRGAYLRSLVDMIGPLPTDRSWRDEWLDVRAETRWRQGETESIDKAWVREHANVDVWLHGSHSACILFHIVSVHSSHCGVCTL